MTKTIPSPRRHKLRNSLIAFVILVGAAHFIGWRFAASEMHQTVDAWVEDQRQAGLKIEHGDITIKGYPFFLRAHAPDVMISDNKAWLWRAEILNIDLLPTALNRLTFRPQGQQSFETNDLGVWQFNTDHAVIHLANDAERSWTLEVSLAAGHFNNNADGLTIDTGPFTLAIAPNAKDETQIDASCVLNAIRVATQTAVINTPLFDANLSLTATHALFENDTGQNSLAYWQRTGGALVLNNIKAQIEESDSAFSGRISVDQNGFPDGIINASVKKPAAIAAALGKAGVLSQRKANAAQAGLTMASIAQGGKIEAPIILADGTASFAGIKLADLPRID